MGLQPRITDRDRPLGLQPLIAHPGLGRQRPRQVPVAFAADRRQDRLAFARPQGQQVLDLDAREAPLFPVAHAHPAAKLLVEFGNRAIVSSPRCRR